MDLQERPLDDVVEVSYGQGKIKLKIPNERYKFIKPLALKGIRGSENIKTTLIRALENPIKTEQLNNLVKNKKVTYLVEDSTRSEPHKELIEASFSKFHEADFINVIITTGSHKTHSKGNLEIVEYIKNAAKSENIDNYEINIHDSVDKGNFKHVGTTSAGTIIEVNKKALDCDIFYITADMKNHYFAGYSNAIKDFLPGICSYKTIEMNHSLALDPKSIFGRHPFHPDPQRQENPLAYDMWEATKAIKNYQNKKDIFVLSTITFDQQLIWAAAGDIREVTTIGIKKIDQYASFKIRPTNYLIVSPGGNPQDLSLHTSQRGVDLTKEAIKKEGEILIIAECADGIAHNENAERFFYQRLAMATDLDEVLKDIEENYVLYEHKAYKSAELLKKVKKIFMFTKLDKKSVESVHMKKIDNPQEVIERWLNESDEKITIIDKANKIAIYGK